MIKKTPTKSETLFRGVGGVLLISILIITSLEATSYETARCIRVIDGDTIELSSGKRVRYIGINTPEIRRTDAITKELGKSAKAFNEDLVLDRTVRLVFDVEQEDKYGNLLAYVYVGNTFVNAELVRSGYASAYGHPPNIRYAEFFEGLEDEAKEGKRGLWFMVEKVRYQPQE